MILPMDINAWLGTVEQCEAIRSFGREYPWECAIEDPEWAADAVVFAVIAEIEKEVAEEAADMLRAALVESASRCGDDWADLDDE